MTVVVPDTNTLVSGFGWSGPPSRIIDALIAARLLAVSSPALLGELERVLGYPKLAKVFPDPGAIVGLLRQIAWLVEADFVLDELTDEPDNRVLEAAVAASADAIVSGDGALLALGSYDGIPIMTARAFLDRFADEIGEPRRASS